MIRFNFRDRVSAIMTFDHTCRAYCSLHRVFLGRIGLTALLIAGDDGALEASRQITDRYFRQDLGMLSG